MIASHRLHIFAVIAVTGAVFYPPFGWAATLMARVDPWLGRCTTFGAAFLVLSAMKPETPSPDTERP